MTNYIFTPPTVREGLEGTKRLFSFFGLDRGVSVKKVAGVYSTTRFEQDGADGISQYDEYYIGGHKYVVSDATRTALINATIGIDSTNFTPA